MFTYFLFYLSDQAGPFSDIIKLSNKRTEFTSMNIDCSASLRYWWQSHYQVADLKEKSAFDFWVAAQSVYEQYCLDNGNHYSFEVFKSETMQLGTGIHLSRRRSGKNNDSHYYNVMPIDLQ